MPFSPNQIADFCKQNPALSLIFGTQRFNQILRATTLNPTILESLFGEYGVITANLETILETKDGVALLHKLLLMTECNDIEVAEWLSKVEGSDLELSLRFLWLCITNGLYSLNKDMADKLMLEFILSRLGAYNTDEVKSLIKEYVSKHITINSERPICQYILAKAKVCGFEGSVTPHKLVHYSITELNNIYGSLRNINLLMGDKKYMQYNFATLVETPLALTCLAKISEDDWEFLLRNEQLLKYFLGKGHVVSVAGLSRDSLLNLTSDNVIALLHSDVLTFDRACSLTGMEVYAISHPDILRRLINKELQLDNVVSEYRKLSVGQSATEELGLNPNDDGELVGICKFAIDALYASQSLLQERADPRFFQPIERPSINEAANKLKSYKAGNVTLREYAQYYGKELDGLDSTNLEAISNIIKTLTKFAVLIRIEQVAYRSIMSRCNELHGLTEYLIETGYINLEKLYRLSLDESGRSASLEFLEFLDANACEISTAIKEDKVTMSDIIAYLTRDKAGDLEDHSVLSAILSDPSFLLLDKAEEVLNFLEGDNNLSYKAVTCILRIIVRHERIFTLIREDKVAIEDMLNCLGRFVNVADFTRVRKAVQVMESDSLYASICDEGLKSTALQQIRAAMDGITAQELRQQIDEKIMPVTLEVAVMLEKICLLPSYQSDSCINISDINISSEVLIISPFPGKDFPNCFWIHYMKDELVNDKPLKLLNNDLVIKVSDDGAFSVHDIRDIEDRVFDKPLEEMPEVIGRIGLYNEECLNAPLTCT